MSSPDADEEASPALGVEASRPAWVVPLRVAVLTLVMVLTVQAVAGGYQYGHGEHHVLSLKGISWADPTAFQNDWFNSHAPQPHVLFDVITFVATRAGMLAPAYFAYWLASLAVCGWSLVVLSDALLPRRARVLEVLAAVLLVTGPGFAMGTFLAVHTQAVPNGLGGALGLATAVALIVRRDRLAIVLATATVVVHVQHGAVAATLLLVVWLVTRDRMRRPVVRWYPLVVVGLLALVLVVSVARGLVGGSADIDEVCRTASPGHCDPSTWPEVMIVGGLIVLGLGVLAPLLVLRKVGLRGVAVVAVPALIAIVALVTDLAGIEPFRSLGRSLFLYRFVMATAPFAVLTPILLLSRALRARPVQVAIAAVAVPVVVIWNRLPEAYLGAYGRSPTRVAEVSAMATVIVLCALLASGLMGPRRPRLAAALPVVGVTIAVLSLLAYGQRATGFVPLAVDYRSDDGSVQVGRRIEQLTAPGSVIVTDPSLPWVRLTSRRAIVVDCKGVPYGGEPWREYRERLADLGVSIPTDCGPEKYALLTPGELEAVGHKYGAEYVLLDPTSAAYAYASSNWVQAGDLGGPMRLFELPAAP